MKRSLFHFTWFVLLTAFYFIVRFCLFDLHGMKQYPLILFAAASFVIAVSMVFNARLLTVFSFGGYAVGFLLGYIFHSEGTDPGGGATDNLWIIWIISFICFCALGVLCQTVPKYLRRITDKKTDVK